MKVAIFTNVALFAIAGLIFYGISLYGTQNDRELIGLWKESEWKYEKGDVYLNDNEYVQKATLSENLKSEVADNIILHQGEYWEFLPGRKLKIVLEDEDLIVDYVLKGRGHILKITHSNDVVEHYTIQRISRHELVLNFYVETQARGIVQLTFERI